MKDDRRVVVAAIIPEGRRFLRILTVDREHGGSVEMPLYALEFFWIKQAF